MKGLVWFRRDLRLRDNPALSAACKECREIVPIFVFDEPLLHSHVFGSACVGFMLGCLEELRRSLAGQGVTLPWRMGEPIEAVLRTAQELKVDAVYWNRDYEPAALERDRTVQQRLAKQGLRVRTFKDHVVFEAEEVRGDRRPLSTLQRLSRPLVDQVAGCAPLPPVRPIRLRRRFQRYPPRVLWPSAEDLGYESVPMWIEPGEQAGAARLQWFLKGPVHDYVNGRNLPGATAPPSYLPICVSGRSQRAPLVHGALNALSKGGQVSRADVLHVDG